MKITKHGAIDPLFMGKMKCRGMQLIFFGWSEGHVLRKAAEWLLINEPIRPSKLFQESQA